MSTQSSRDRARTPSVQSCLIGLIALLPVALLHAQAVGWEPGPGVVAYEDRAVGDTYIVLHQAQPLALYDGAIDGLAATLPRLLDDTRLDLRSVASLEYLAFLDTQHDALIAAVEAALGRSLEVKYRMRHALNGFTAVMSPAEARTVAGLPGVKRVEAGVALDLHTDNGPAWIGADAVYGGSGTVDGVGTMGEGIVVGVIDSGVNFDHPSFAAVGPVDGYVHENPNLNAITGAPAFLGLCDPLTGQPFCNNKLIGVWDFTGTTPLDDNGHGSHTASTVAGNIVDGVLAAPTVDFPRRLGGVAPHANIITYKGCITSPLLGACLSPSTTVAINRAVADGVDVINFSIGGPAGDPWSDAGAQAFAAARTAGVFVATSAGNSGPGAATVGSPADAPWLTSVAASTHDREFGNRLISLTGGNSTPPADIAGKSLTGPLPETPIVYAGDFGDAICAAPFAAGTFNGEIVLCDRGENARTEKAENAQAGGAGGFILANDEPNGNSTVADGYVVPGVHISFADGVAVKTWLADGGDDHAGQVEGTQALRSNNNGDVMAGFSSRGPNPSAPAAIKPDITAPGVDVLAAVSTEGLLQDLFPQETAPEYGVISGTSMSSPHIAGAAALVRALQPDWTPDQVKSALMSTAYVVRGKTAGDGNGLVKEDGQTPADVDDVGAGRVDLTQAARAGFLLDETQANYDAANPSMGGDPSTLNLASLGQANCANTCSWTRTIVGTIDAQWTTSVVSADGMEVTVTPATFSLAPDESQTLEIEANVARLANGSRAFADVIFTPDVATIPTAHFPVAVFVESQTDGDDDVATGDPVGDTTDVAAGGGGAIHPLSLLALTGLLLARRRRAALTPDTL